MATEFRFRSLALQSALATDVGAPFVSSCLSPVPVASANSHYTASTQTTGTLQFLFYCLHTPPFSEFSLFFSFPPPPVVISFLMPLCHFRGASSLRESPFLVGRCLLLCFVLVPIFRIPCHFTVLLALLHAFARGRHFMISPTSRSSRTPADCSPRPDFCLLLCAPLLSFRSRVNSHNASPLHHGNLCNAHCSVGAVCVHEHRPNPPRDRTLVPPSSRHFPTSSFRLPIAPGFSSCPLTPASCASAL